MIVISDEPVMWLRGERCGLGPLRRDLVELYWQWENELRVMTGNGRQTPESLDERTSGLDSQMRHSMNQVRFTIYDLTSPEPVPVGTADLVIQHRWRNAEFFILLGDAESRGRGIGTEATRLVLDYAFHITNLQNVYLSVLALNKTAIRAYEKAGFHKIGERRQSGYWLGERVNEVLMDAIPADFPGPSTVKHTVKPAL
ncbi:MAG: GNAT family N-acetyltransferase [Pseudonocardiales bacterium]